MIKIKNCYDSHVHWLGTGQFNSTLRLESLTSPEQLSQMQLKKDFFNKDWLIGFGWDDSNWTTKPSLGLLDSIFSNFPVALVKKDAHAVWVNSLALMHLNAVPPDVLVSGLFIEENKKIIDEILPKLTVDRMETFLLKAQKIFHRSGITHIRDVTCNEQQWRAARNLELEGQLQLAVEVFFYLKDRTDLSAQIHFCLKAQQEKSLLLKPLGLKVFFDGSLGSSTALLSENYLGQNHNGQQLISEEHLEKIFIECWQQKLEVAVHVIGDLACEKVVSIAEKLWRQGLYGRLHLEHAQLIDPKTIDRMTHQNIVVHMQPCQWLSDKNWLEKKLSPILLKKLFPWQQLSQKNILLYFGSDTPVENCSIEVNCEAIEDAYRFGIERPQHDTLYYHQNNNFNLNGECISTFDKKKVQVIFNNKIVYSN